MPLHGKIVVIKRSGGDGTEFPLTATCLFGRKPECDIRIQLPQVSKEQCRIELNENKEVILINLSSANPTRVNGEVLQQSERLKHGDIITIIDRSFRFEYPPAPTPKKKKSSLASKTETLQVLQDQQVSDATTAEAGRKTSEVTTDSHLKDGANHDNIQRSLEKTFEVETKADRSLDQSKTSSPFNELYQIIKKSLDIKTPRKSSISLPQTPASRFYAHKPVSVRKVAGEPAISTEFKSTPKKVEAEESSGTITTDGNAEAEESSGTITTDGNADAYLKDGANHDNIQRSLEKTFEVGTKADGSLDQSKTSSPFNELYQIIKQSLDIKTPRKSSVSLPQTPASRFYAQKPVSVRKVAGEPAISTEFKSTPKKVEPEESFGTITTDGNAEAEESSGTITTDGNAEAEESSGTITTDGNAEGEESSGTITIDGNAEGGRESGETGTPKSAKKQPKSLDIPISQGAGLAPEENKPTEQATKPNTPIQETPRSKRRSSSSRTPTTTEAISTPAQKTHQTTPQRFTVSEVVEQIIAENPTTPIRRRSKQGTPIKATLTEAQKEPAEAQPSTPKPEVSPRTSPRSSEKKLKAQNVLRELEAAASEKQVSAKKRKSGELGLVSKQKTKRKRVSFGGHLSPELFDKRLPPDSPLRKGASPRRSLCVPKQKQSLLRRASVIGLIKESGLGKPGSASPKGKSPAKKSTPSPAKGSPSPKSSSPAKRSPNARTPSPKSSSPAKRSPKAQTPSPKSSSPAKRSPNARTPSPSKNKSPTTKAKTPSLGKSEVTSSPGRKSLPAAAKTPSPARGRSSSKDKPQTPKAEKSPKPQIKSTSQPQSVDKKTPIGKRMSSPVASTATPQENIPTVVAVTPAKTHSPKSQTPTVQGRFSVSHISTPSPISEQDAVAVPESAVDVTPTLPLRRKSMKSTSKRTPKSVLKSVVAAMRRRSGVSRASMKVVSSWADIVKFGQTKSQMVVPAKKPLTKTKTKKVVVPKPKTPARKLQHHVSTGHADSPVTIVVGRAHKQKILQPTGAAPKLVQNIALFKKNMKMDEDLTGIAEIFSTPVNARRRTSVINVQTATKTPQAALSTSVIDASAMNTPEETGEMAVSPLSVASTAKCGRYNKEAVNRLLESDQETSFVCEIPADPVEDLRGKLLKTPRVPRAAEEVSFDGVKELLETPKRSEESVEDLVEVMGTETPEIDNSPLVCAIGIKRVTETSKERGAPVEDMVAIQRLMKTPKQKLEPVEKNFGIQNLMKMPRLSGNTPVEDLEGLQQLMEDPQCDLGAHTDANEGQGETPPDATENVPQEDMTKETGAVCEAQPDDGTYTQGEDGPADVLDNVPQEDTAPGVVCEEQQPPADGPSDASQEDIVLEVVCEQPEETSCVQGEDGSSDTVDNVLQEVTAQEPVVVCKEQPEDVTFAQGEDGPSDTVDNIEDEAQEPEVVCEEKPEDVSCTQGEDETQAVVSEEQPEDIPCAQEEDGPSNTVENVSLEDEEKEPAVVCEEKPEDVSCTQDEEGPSDTVDNVGQEDETEVGLSLSKEEPEVVCEEQPEDMPCAQGEDGPSDDNVENVPQEDIVQEPAVVCEEQPEDMPCAQGEDGQSAATEDIPQVAIDQHLPEVEPAVTEGTTSSAPEPQKRSARGRNAKTVEPTAVDATEQPEETTVPALVRGRRGKKIEVAAPPMVRQSARSRAVKANESNDVEVPVEANESVALQEAATLKPRKGRNAKQGSLEQAETVLENTGEATSDQTPPTNVEPQVIESVVPQKAATLKPKRGRNTKQASLEQAKPVQENTEATRDETLPIDNVEPGVSDTVMVSQQEATSKPRKGRNAKQASLEQAETVLENTIEATSDKNPPTNVEPEVTESVVPQRAATLKPKRGRNAKQASLEQAKPVQENAEATRDETPPIDIVEPGVSDTVMVSQQEATSKPRKGRNAKQASLEQAETVLENTVEATSDKIPPTNVEREVTESVVPQRAATLKPKRGRNAKQASLEQAKPVQENAEATRDETPPIDIVEPGVSEEATLKPRRGRNAKKAYVEQAETVQDNTMEVVNDQAPPKDNVESGVSDAVAPQEEAASKPRRGKRGKQVSVKQASVEQAPTVQENTEVLNDKPPPTEDGHAQEPIPITMNDEPRPTEDVQAQESVTVENPRRGRKTKQDPIEQSKVVEEGPVKVVETEQVAQAPVRAKRGRKTKQDSEEKAEADFEIPPVESLEINEPVEKPSRLRKAKQDSVEQSEAAEVPTVETPVTEKMVAPAPISKPSRGRKAKQVSVEPAEEPPVESANVETPAEATEEHEQTAMAPADKPRRGGRKTKQAADSVIHPESTEVQDKPSANPSERTKRGRNIRQEKVDEEVVTILQEQEEKAEPKQEEVQVADAEPASNPAEQQPGAPAVKTTRGRKVNSAVKDDVSQVVPSKRARREAAHSLQETAVVEAIVPVSKSAPRGRAGKQSKAEEADNPAEVPAEPVRKGRKAAAKPAVVATDNATAVPSTEKMEEEEVALVEVKKGRAPRKGKAASEVRNGQTNADEDVSSAVVKNTEMPNKSVNWKAELTETHLVTPVVRAARGRKAKLVDEDKDEASQAVSTKRGCRSSESGDPSTSQATASKPVNKRKVSSKAEEEALPVKRTRWGAKATDSAPVEAITPVTEELSETTDEAPDKGRGKAPRKGKAASKMVDNVQPVEPETQPKPRRGRAAKK